MRTVIVVVSDVLDRCLLEMLAPEDENSISALSADGADEPLGERVRSWRSNEGLDDFDALGAEHLVETGGELGVPVADDERG